MHYHQHHHRHPPLRPLSPQWRKFWLLLWATLFVAMILLVYIAAMETRLVYRNLTQPCVDAGFPLAFCIEEANRLQWQRR